VTVINEEPRRGPGEQADETSGRRARRREVRTEAVLDVASRIVAREGLEGLTLGKVAGELDLVGPALYRYFASKDALVAALQRRAIGVVLERLRSRAAELEPRLERLDGAVASLARLLSVARAYLALPEREPEAWPLLATMLGDPRRLLSDAEARQGVPLVLGLVQDVERLFTVAAREGALSRGDAQERTLGLWAALHGALALDKLLLLPSVPAREGAAGRGSALGEATVTALLRGWGAEAALLSRARRALD
jgi:AcrR family transcriptional regulator